VPHKSLFFKKDLFIYLSERERKRERQHKQEGQRERERESQMDSFLSTEPHVGFDPGTLRS